ncbi:hypothetical protein MASR2M15_27870 [Anaerolineales bacterium]
MTDTRGFRTSNVNALTLEIASQLSRFGASLTKVTALALDNKDFATIELWKSVLPTATLKGQVATAYIPFDPAIDSTTDSFDGSLVSFLLDTREVMVPMICKEISEQQTKISLRCKPGFDVSELAASLGGGGHRQPAGATLNGSAKDVIETLQPKLQAIVAAGNLQIK